MTSHVELSPDNDAESAPALSLDKHGSSQLLRVCAIGSVDDGKSTLIGRFLHDTHQLYEDQLAALERASRRKGHATTELAFATDGLRAEREQGITIDVAYRYAVTTDRTVIIADCPGHVEYTRNMATGASTADAAVMVIDVEKGVREQTKRHLVIARLLGVEHLVVAVNKMDLAKWDRETFEKVGRDVRSLTDALSFTGVTIVPTSALLGDNVLVRSDAMPWYEGPPVFDSLKSIPANAFLSTASTGTRFPVQWIVRSGNGGREYAGMVVGQPIHVGQHLVVLPDEKSVTVTALRSFETDLADAEPGQSVTLDIEGDIDLTRGDLLADPRDAPHPHTELVMTVLWFSDQPATAGLSCVIKHTTRSVRCSFVGIAGTIDLDSVTLTPSHAVENNEIGVATVRLSAPIAADMYTSCRMTGSVLFIDPLSGLTLGCGLVGPAPFHVTGA